jgi:hypothetical protein
VLTALEGLPLDITLHKTTSGIAALLTGNKPGPTVMLRGDMDARLRTGLSSLDEPLKRLPSLEQRLGDVERNVAEMRPDPAQPQPGEVAAAP